MLSPESLILPSLDLRALMLATVAKNRKHAVLMKEFPDMEHDDPNGKRLTVSELLWRFTNAGEFEFACLIPGHYEAGMKRMYWKRYERLRWQHDEAEEQFFAMMAAWILRLGGQLRG
jgi:hypothetical protein